jgi:hypothetical protein
MWRIFLFSFTLIGCSVKPPQGCNFDLADWNKVNVIPTSLQSSNKANITHWYTNNVGDYFYCNNFVGINVCGQDFEIHYKNQDGSYSSDVIMCMQ